MARAPLPHWQAALLRGVALVALVFALGGALSLLAIALLGNGRGIGQLNFSWALFGLSLAAGAAQLGLSLIGFKAAWRWIGARAGAGPELLR